MATKILVANYFRRIARYGLLVMSVFVFFFALFSGAENYGGGIEGIMLNSPNAMPWLILLLFLLIAWHWELLGGVLIMLIGLTLLYFFNFQGPNFFLTTFILTILITILGLFFMISWYLRQKR